MKGRTIKVDKTEKQQQEPLGRASLHTKNDQDPTITSASFEHHSNDCTICNQKDDCFWICCVFGVTLLLSMGMPTAMYQFISMGFLLLLVQMAVLSFWRFVGHCNEIGESGHKRTGTMLFVTGCPVAIHV